MTSSKTPSLLRIAIPMLAAMMVGQIERITDQIFLGHANSAYLTAIGNAGFTFWTTISFLFALGTGTTILVSQKIGEGDTGAAERLLGTTFAYSSLFSGALFLLWFFGSETIFALMGLSGEMLGFASSYTRIYSFSILLTGLSTASNSVFQGSGNTRPMLYSSIIRTVTNVILDPILIFGLAGFPALGIEGAAIATLAADIAGAAYLVPRAFRNRGPVRLSLKAIRAATPGAYGRIIAMGIPAGLEEFLWNVGNIMLIRFLNEIDTLAAGIYTIVMTVTLLPSLFYMALGSAGMTVSGINTGAGDPGAIRKATGKSMGICLAVTAAFGAAFMAFPREITALFTKDGAVVAASASMLWICTLTLLPRFVNIVYGGAIRGMGDTRWMLWTQVVGTALILVVARVFIFGAGLAVFGLFLAVFVDEALRSVANGARFHGKIRERMKKSTAAVQAA